MALDVVPVAFGPPAHDELARVVAQAKRHDPLRPVTVVVPSNYVGVASRRRLAEANGLIGVTFLTVYRLAELLGAAALAGKGRRPVSNPVLLVAVQEQLQRAPGVFAAVREHPATEEAVVGVHKQLADLSPGALAALGRASPQAGDLVRLHRAVKEQLSGSWFDEADLVEAAMAELGRDHPVARALGDVVVFLPQRLTRAACQLLARIAHESSVTVLAGVTGVARADEELRITLARLGAAEPELHAGAATPPSVTVVTASDADEEVRAAVRAVVEAARSGTPLERMAIVHPGTPHYAALVHHQLDAASIPTNGAAPDRLADSVAGSTLLQLLALAGRPPRRHDVLGLLAAAPARLPSGRRVPSVAWERISRDAGVVGTTATEWQERLTRFAAEQQEQARAYEADDREALARRLRRTAEQSLALRDFVTELLDRLAALADSTTWSKLSRGCATLLGDLLGGEPARASWPPLEQDAAAKVEAMLERLAHLDEVATGPTLDRFARTVALELEADLGRRGRFGEGVLVGRLGLVTGLDLDLVIVLGLAEGVLPSRQHDDALLPDRDRAAAGGELPLAADRQRREHQELLVAVATGAQVVLSMPRGDLRRTTEHVASRWLLELVTSVHGEELWSEQFLQHQAPWLDHVGSFSAGIRRPGRAATVQEARVRLVLAGDTLPGDLAYSMAQAAVTARHDPRFGRFDGNLEGLSIPSPTLSGNVVSPTRLESWAACPYAYFLRYVLHVEAVEDPDEVLDMSPLDRGTLIHQAMEQYVDARLRDGTAAGAVDPDRLHHFFELACQVAEARGLTGRPLLWRHARATLWRHLLAFATADAERCAHEGLEPLAAELRFGFGEPPVEVTLGPGRSLRFRGSADRVDRAAHDEHLVVTDYKYGSDRKFKTLGPDNPTGNGTLLQLPIYALAAQARYDLGRLPWPPVARYAFARPDKTDRRPKDRVLTIDDQVLAEWRHALDVIVDGIERGHFPARPGDDSSLYIGYVACDACDPDGLGTVELQRRWAQLVGAPELADYVDLLGLGPEDDDDD